MAMPVAVKNTPETASSRPLNRLAVGSLAGALYVLGGLAIVFWGVRNVWDTLAHSFVEGSLLLLVMLAVAAGLVVLGRWLLGSHPPHGLRAGIFFGAVGLLAIGLLTRFIGGLFERGATDSSSAVGLLLTVVIGLLLLGLGAYGLFRPKFNAFAELVEDQGWFTTAPYKRSQGQRVRRGTILGVLVLAACGVFTLLSQRSLEVAGVRHWEIVIPFAGGKTLTLLPDVQFTVPILIGGVALWFAYRLVNFPAFADFLIATEAELNKVSWTTRKRLIQDTIVVLTTMLLLTFFLLFVDLIWLNVLKNPWIGVLQKSASASDVQQVQEEIDRLSGEREQAVAEDDKDKAARLSAEISQLVRRRDSMRPKEDW
jgi:preprotein translocase SecE subunit